MNEANINDDELLQLIGARVIYLRKKLGLKQIELANKINIEDSALRRIESGKTNPTIKTLHKIAQALNVKLVDLFQFDEL